VTTPPSSEPVLIQPVESPVICKPYYEPTLHYEYDRTTGRATKEPGRRPAMYWYKLSDEEVRQQKLPLHFKDARGDEIRLELDEGRRELVLVNKLRSDVKRWRNSNYEGATNVTKDLLRHWSRKDRPRRLFFCQLEAAETVIFLNEIRGTRKDKSRGKPRWNPDFTDADFERLVDPPFDTNYSPLSRMCCKMATGSGKTVVMAMLIAWAFCNRARVPSDERFPMPLWSVAPISPSRSACRSCERTVGATTTTHSSTWSRLSTATFYEPERFWSPTGTTLHRSPSTAKAAEASP